MSALQAPHLIDVTTLGDLLLRAVVRDPDREAVIFPDARFTYRALWERAVERARSLHGLGIGPGDHVGILMPNCPEFVELLLGATLCGAVSVPINARFKAPELAYVVENADLKGLITTDVISEYADFAALLHEALPELQDAARPAELNLSEAPLLRFAALFGAPQPGFLDQQAFEAAAQRVAPETIETLRQRGRVRDVCMMMYTSGTTANPKGCPLTHESLVRNGINMNRERYFLEAEDRFWAPLPMFHMSSILPMTACFDAGATWLTMRRVEAGAALQMLEEERVTVAFPSFPTVTSELIAHPDFPSRDLSRIRRINNVAPPDVLRKFQEAFPQAVQTGAYGLTEAGGVIAFNHPDEPLEERLTACGRPFPGIEVRIVDLETGRDLPTGQRGELWTRGYCLFEGYYKSPEKNAESLVDGWLRTGDLCALNANGGIEFHGRIKDMLKVGGENVAALEIESHLATHPAIKLAQVIGVPDARLTEVPAAFIELAPGAALTEEEVIAHCRGKIAGFKVPRHVRFVTEWPMSSTKIQKFKLQERFDREGSQ